MEVLPAIDLLEGKCVRFVQGRYDRVIEYEHDPVAVTERFLEAGATWVHVIDVEGALAGSVRNHDALKRITAAGAKVEFGGGVRDESAIDAALAAGAERVIVGTRALEDTDWFRKVAHQEQYARRIVLGLDARQGKVAIHGWTRDTQRTAADVADSVHGWPLARICYTDIGRDGMLLGPNLEAIRNLATISTIPVEACGGVSDLEDVRGLCGQNLAGIVIGRALYERTIDLREALAAASSSA